MRRPAELTASCSTRGTANKANWAPSDLGVSLAVAHAARPREGAAVRWLGALRAARSGTMMTNQRRRTRDNRLDSRSHDRPARRTHVADALRAGAEVSRAQGMLKARVLSTNVGGGGFAPT